MSYRVSRSRLTRIAESPYFPRVRTARVRGCLKSVGRRFVNGKRNLTSFRKLNSAHLRVYLPDAAGRPPARSALPSRYAAASAVTSRRVWKSVMFACRPVIACSTARAPLTTAPLSNRPRADVSTTPGTAVRSCRHRGIHRSRLWVRRGRRRSGPYRRPSSAGSPRRLG